MKMFVVTPSPHLQEVLAVLTQKIIYLALYLEALPLLHLMPVNM
jgi:hypothetical protein